MAAECSVPFRVLLNDVQPPLLLAYYPYMASNSADLLVFVTELLRVSEKAAHIARLCRAERTLFELLVEEKTEGEKNQRFKQDFKTLADVLIQEMVRQHIGMKVA